MEARVALVANQPIFFPILETEAISRNAPGNIGANNSMKLDTCINPDAKYRYYRNKRREESHTLLGWASNFVETIAA
jgi:hypothetical protein